MSMPEAALNENCEPPGSKHDVRLAWRLFGAIPIAHRPSRVTIAGRPSEDRRACHEAVSHQRLVEWEIRIAHCYRASFLEHL